MKKLFTFIVLTISVLSLMGQSVTLNGDTAIFNEEGIVLNANFTPTTSGTWYWATTDAGLDLGSQHGSSLSVTPSDTGVFLFRAVFYDGVRSFFQDFKVTVAPCGSKLILKDYENQTYRSKRYGSVCWMAQNLRSTLYSPDGTAVPFAHTYNDNDDFAEEFGRLYTYNSALNGGTGNTVQGVCPTGWQIPMETHLSAVINQNPNAYTYQSGAWLSNGATNSENFYLYPAGFYNASTGRYENMYGEAYLILNTPIVTNNQIRVGGCSHNCPYWLINDVSLDNAYSVRCIKTHPLIDITREAPRRLHTIQYIGNGAETGSMPPQTGIGDSSATLAANLFGHSGNWQFKGWNTRMDGTGVSFTDGQTLTLTQDTVLYAQWETYCSGAARYAESGTGRVDSVQDHQNNWYKVVQIGKQCWLKENMRATTEPGSPNSILMNPAGATSRTEPRAYCYNNSMNNSDKYGLLYNFPAAMNITDQSSTFTENHRGICPEGWHIPTDAEWSSLATAAGCTAAYNSGTGLGKLTGGCEWSTSSNATAPGNYSYAERNSSGFSALPAASYYGQFSDIGGYANFWSSTPEGSDNAWRRYFYSGYENVTRHNIDRNNAFSVRCVRDTIDTLTFMPKGGSGTMLQQYVKRGVETALNANGFTHDSRDFLGWSTSNCDNTVAYTDQANITTNGNDTLYAVWHTYCTGTPRSNEIGSSRIDSVKDHQDNWYMVVQIGDQCWLKENMRCTTTPRQGQTMGSSQMNLTQGSAPSEGTPYYYDYSQTNGSQPQRVTNLRDRGYLYNYNAAIDTVTSQKLTQSISNRRGICPEGWHLPTDLEWKTLERGFLTEKDRTTPITDVTLDSIVDRGIGAGKFTDGSAWNDSHSSGTYPNSYSYAERNSTAFSVLPAGGYNGGNTGGFTEAGKYAFFWSTTFLKNYPLERRFGNAYEGVYRTCQEVKFGRSVRCVRDTNRLSVNDTITFMPNGGTGTMEKQVVSRGMETALSNSTFTHTGNWQFTGWSTSVNGSVNYAPGANITTYGNDTLYAQWHTWCTGTPKTNESGNSRIDSVKDASGNAYSVVQIGEQCWLKQNLRTTSYADNTAISTDSIYTPSNPDSLGRFYKRGTVIGGNLCPQGWHLPKKAEFDSLTTFVNDHFAADSGKYAYTLASTSWEKITNQFVHQYYPAYNPAANNTSGFSATAGYCFTYQGVHLVTNSARYLVSDTSLVLKIDDMYVADYDNSNDFLHYPVRCVRDAEVAVNDTITFMPNGATGGTMEKQVIIRGTATALNANQFTHDGNWQFTGWNDACDGNGASYANQANITTNGNVTLYAQWHTYCTGTARGNELGTSRIDSVKDHQNNWYKIVETGTGNNKQCWLKENMRCTTSPKGYLTAGGNNTNNYLAYYYDYSSDTLFSLRERGYLYNWAGAIDTNGTSNITASFTGRRGICPEGWHIPTDDEWKTLESGYLTETDGSPISQSNLDAIGYRGKGAGKFTGGCDWLAHTKATAPGNYSYSDRNTTGFSALPSGSCYGNTFYNAGEKAWFWSATSSDGTKAYRRNFGYSNMDVWHINKEKHDGLSVRCVRDAEVALTPKLGLCETCSEGTITVKVSENVASIVWRNANNDSVSNCLTGLTQSATIPAGVYTATAKSIDGSTVTRTATLGKATAHPCTVTSLNAGTSLPEGKYANKEFGNGTLLDSVSDHEGNVYRVVQVGEGANAQCWLAENMRCTTSPSTNSTIVLGGFSSWICAHHSKCAINDTLRYGVLYNWCAAVDTFDAANSKPEVANADDSQGWDITLPAGNRRGICPKGWHVPTNDEWTNLASLAGVGQSSSDTGVSKLSGGCDWPTKDNGMYPGSYADPERNSTGFSALPAGNKGGMRTHVGIMAFFWSATSNGQYAYARIIDKDKQYLETQSGTARYSALSVRCVRDAEVAPGFTCGTSTVSDHEGNVYHTLKIGTQCWTKENMRCTTSPSTGTYIVTRTTPNDTNYTCTGKQARWYNNDSTTYAPQGYGLLYNWNAAVDTFNNEYNELHINTELVNSPDISSFSGHRRGICPQGWHVPRSAEWTQLISYVKSQPDYVSAGCSGTDSDWQTNCIAKSLASTTGWTSDTASYAPGNTPSSNNATGFSALPAGYYQSVFAYVGEDAHFWSASQQAGGRTPFFFSYSPGLFYKNNHVSTSNTLKSFGYSVRCLKDMPLMVITDSVSGGGKDSPIYIYSNVVDDGGKSVTARGVCWGESANPTINDNHTTDGTGTGSFTSTLTDLESSTTYYVRAYATNSDDTVYGNQITFTTGNCIAAGTRITMADGSYKNVEDIVVGDRVRTFNHETGNISSAEICLAWKSENTKPALNLTFASGKTVGIVGKHDFLLENTRKYVRISKDNVAEYVGKRFYNAENGFWDTLVSYETGAAVNYYCPYTAKHLNCIAEGMLSCPDDVDYLLNIYELDANLKADSVQLAADIAQYGLCNVAQDFPEFAQYKEQMEKLGCLYIYLAIGKGLVPASILDEIKDYWTVE